MADWSDPLAELAERLGLAGHVAFQPLTVYLDRRNLDRLGMTGAEALEAFSPGVTILESPEPPAGLPRPLTGEARAAEWIRRLTPTAAQLAPTLPSSIEWGIHHDDVVKPGRQPHGVSGETQ